MQALIADLLELSRVGRTTDEFVPVPLDAALDRALEQLDEQIATSGAQIERVTPLPTVPGDRVLLTSLLENLVGNAIKYRREGVAPVVRISAEHDEPAQRWTVTVADNGIGIDPQYAEKIFAIFQRLHLRDSYGGTGIGLALCRRIVEFHGGDIWLDDVGSDDTGATFRFALPEGDVHAEPRN
jgi:light-regulated signal transduction histidine kinase (bacteriophytochrome)